MATAPFQLWLDLAQISSAVRTSGTVTVTTASPHGITTGAYIQMDGAAGVAGTSMNGVYQVTVTSGSTFTYTSSGTAGTGVTGSAAISYDLLNPLINYSGSAKESALYVPTDSLLFGISGDGSGASSSMTVFQDDVPADGPWFNLVPDQSRVRLVKANTGGTAAADGSDLYFTSLISNVSAAFNGSGQGVTANVSMQDMTSLLDKVFIYPPGKQMRFIKINGVVRENNITTITTNVGHGFGAIGSAATVSISQVTGGGTATFNKGSQIITIESANSFYYSNSGPAGTGNFNISPTSITSSGSFFYVVMPDIYHNLDGEPVIINGVTGGDEIGRNLINRVWQSSSFPGTAPGTMRLDAGTALATSTFNVDTATVRGYAVVTPLGTLDGRNLTIPIGTTESDIVKDLVENIDAVKAADPAFQRAFSTGNLTKIGGSTTTTNREALDLAPQGIRGVLDEVVSIFQGIDGKPRRYFVDPNGKLNYAIADDADAPTYATAPYKLITSGAQDPNTTSAAATLIPYNLEIGLDYHMTKAGIPTGNDDESLTVTTYQDYEYPERKNAPLFDQQIDEPAVGVDQYKDNSYRYARSFFSQAYAPLLSGRATIRGAGTAAHNQYGFSAGYAQTGASTFALVKRWEPGQWVSITAAELGLSGLYRIEQVDWTLERGSFTQIIVITFSYKPPFTLTNQLSQVR